MLECWKQISLMLLTFEYCQAPVSSSNFSSTGSVNVFLHLVIIDNGSFDTNTTRHSWWTTLIRSMIHSHTVELRSEGFHGTGLIFPIDWNSFIANIEINKKMTNGTENNFPYKWIPLLPGPLEQSSTVSCFIVPSSFDILKKVDFHWCAKKPRQLN